MDLPVKFPSETEVILEDVARFRALSSEERILTIETMLADGLFLMSRSPTAERIDKNVLEQKRLERARIQEFIKRHAY